MNYVRFSLMNAVSGAASANSNAFDSDQLFSFSMQFIVSGNMVGSFKIQVSNDSAPPGANGVAVPTNWSDLPGSDTAINAGTATVYLIPKQDLGYRFIRVVYTRTSGTGSMSANVFALGI